MHVPWVIGRHLTLKYTPISLGYNLYMTVVMLESCHIQLEVGCGG